ncbi:ghrelin O-acyltransferase [Hypanus sabinus]|uniref:ghrelin O-acyltransferase n=1 Tax=Hypanus sabinus TaxID=79690 RepID=UPI0028C4C40E|nr:ghrelin O-acyltransferase [Hypanus sabinus]
MDSAILQYELDCYPVTIYQFMCVPLASIFYLLSITGHLSLTASHAFLLSGGLLMTAVSMGPYTILLLISAVLSVMLLHLLEPRSVHKWTFLTQMTWQTLCHLWLHYNDYYLQEATDIKFLIALSALMLLTQRITSTSLDVHEGEITVPDILLIWITALTFRLAYYSQWFLNESLMNLIGLGLENKTEKATLSDTDIWTLETTDKISEIARAWNKTTALWLRRMVFQRSKVQPLLSTFAFSAWWHGLHPGQIFGFILWAITVQADYYIHQYLNSVTVRSRFLRFFYKPLMWVQTQLITAYILVAVELRSFSCVLILCKSACAVSPLLYVLLLIYLANKK